MSFKYKYKYKTCSTEINPASNYWHRNETQPCKYRSATQMYLEDTGKDSSQDWIQARCLGCGTISSYKLSWVQPMTNHELIYTGEGAPDREDPLGGPDVTNKSTK